MTDRELLELAAKAAGIETRPEYASMENGYGLNVKPGYYWNPLTDDGDALRLAVKLGIDTLITKATASIIGETTTFGPFEEETGVASERYVEPHNDDPHAATRRAIVRAAAEIGKAM